MPLIVQINDNRKWVITLTQEVKLLFHNQWHSRTIYWKPVVATHQITDALREANEKNLVLDSIELYDLSYHGDELTQHND